MKTLLLYLFPLALMLGGAFLGWLARWYKYGGRCAPGGIAKGIPNVDMKRGLVILDGSASAASADAKAALGSLTTGYEDGKRDGAATMSAGAKIGAAAGSAVAAVGTGVAGASDALRSTAGTLKDKAADAVDATRSSLSSAKEGYAEGKAPGETSGTPADGSGSAKMGAAVGGAVSAAQDTAANAVEGTKSALASMGDGVASATDKVAGAAGRVADSVASASSGAVDATRSSLSSAKEGYAEGKAPGETSGTPADGSGSAKMGAAATLAAGAASLTSDRSDRNEGEPGATIGQEDGHLSGEDDLAALQNVDVDVDVDDGGGATQSEIALSETLSDTEQEAQRLIDSGVEVVKPVSALTAPRQDRNPDDLKRIKGIGPKIEGTLNDEGIYYFDQIAGFGAPDIAWADKTLAIKGRVVRDRWVPQAQGLAALGPAGSQTGADTAALRTRFAALSEDATDEATRGSGMDAGVLDIPDSLSDVEEEAQRLIESDAVVTKPASALAAPSAGRAPDDLKLISGIGPKIEETLNGEGVYYFDQIAGFGGRDLAWADRTLGFRGRVVRDRWIPQAKGLAARQDLLGSGSASIGQDGGSSHDATTNAPLRLNEAEALRLIERDGGYSATEQNRPDMLMRDGPVGGTPDDLKEIKGIGNKLEGVLNGMGVYYFRQIAAFSANDIAWVDSKLKFKGRIIRDRWVPQADAIERNRRSS